MTAGEIMHQLRLELWTVTYARYLEQELFSWQWWAIVAFLVFLYAAWWRFVAKDRLLEIMLFGSFVSVSGAIIDIWGVTTAHWQYNIRLFPLLPAPFPFDYTAAPILLMLAYQRCRSWKIYLLWSAACAALFSFGMLRLFEAAGIITLFNWSLFYSFGIFWSVAIVARTAILLTLKVAAADRAKTRFASRFSPLVQPAAKPLPDEETEGKQEE